MLTSQIIKPNRFTLVTCSSTPRFFSSRDTIVSFCPHSLALKYWLHDCKLTYLNVHYKKETSNILLQEHVSEDWKMIVNTDLNQQFACISGILQMQREDLHVKISDGKKWCKQINLKIVSQRLTTEPASLSCSGEGSEFAKRTCLPPYYELDRHDWKVITGANAFK